ncbi:MAG: SEC-C metal-binding domain-containing protein [Candidatus Buchananbacteria bacterium]
MENNIELRKQLLAITENNSYDSHESLINKLKDQFFHSIQIIESVSPNREKNFVCFMHAFDLRDSVIIKNEMRKKLEVTFGSDFISWLIDKGYLTQNKNANIVIYFDDKIPKHAGLVIGNKIISKWGMGNTWQHDLWEVPSSYGNSFDYFELSVKSEEIEKEFVSWVKIRFYSRVGRNESCPCNSGKKFNQCHGK